MSVGSNTELVNHQSSVHELPPAEFMASFASSIPKTIRSERLRNICRFVAQMGLEPMTNLVVDHPNNPSYFAFIPFKDGKRSNSVHCYAREDRPWEPEKFRKWLNVLPVDWKDPSLIIAQQFEPLYSEILAHWARHVPEGYKVPEALPSLSCTSLILPPEVDISHFNDPDTLPPDLFMDRLYPVASDVDTVISNWPYAYPGVEHRFMALLDKLPSSCVRSRKTGELLCYNLTNEDGSMGTLYVQPQARRQGLAVRVTGGLVDKLRALDVLPLAEVVAGNIPPKVMLNKLGFIDSKRYTFWSRLLKVTVDDGESNINNNENIERSKM